MRYLVVTYAQKGVAGLRLPAEAEELHVARVHSQVLDIIHRVALRVPRVDLESMGAHNAALQPLTNQNTLRGGHRAIAHLHLHHLECHVQFRV